MLWKNLLALATLALAAATATAATPALLPTATPDFVVNTYVFGTQYTPSVAADAAGGFVVAWIEAGEQPGGIKARRFEAGGAPAGPEIWVDKSPRQAQPRIASAADGSFAVVWTDLQNVWLRRFGSDGQPLAAKQQINPPGPGVPPNQFPDVAMAPGGSFVVVWLRAGAPPHSAIFAQRFDAAGGRVGAAVQVSPDGFEALYTPRVVMAADGGFLAVWEKSGTIVARRFGPSGDGAPAIRIDDARSALNESPATLLHADGTATVVWTSDKGLLGRGLDAAGSPLAPEIVLAPAVADPIFPPALAADAAGNALVAWEDLQSGQVRARLFDRRLSPRSEVFTVGEPAYIAWQPALAATASGAFVAMWTSGESFDFFPFIPFIPFPFPPPPPPIPGKDGDSEGVVGKLLGPLACAPDSGVLCLGAGGRFEARVAWANPFNGQTGTGHPRSLTADTGAFWFFSNQNLELMVKVLDGTAVNGHFWVYAGSLSNVEYTLTVTDTVTGAERSYHNPPFQFVSRADVNAFPAAATGADTALQLAAMTAPIVRDAPIVGCLPVSAGPSTSLCLASGHFTVSVDFKNPRLGLTGHATAVPLTSDTGAFWFFSETNLELMVKVLDGRAVNGKFWVFFGALSDVEYTITVTRPETGEVRTYHNPQGNLASRADTQAF